jgi:hypothetical protein
MAQLIRAVGDAEAQQFITDELTFKDKVSGAIQVQALTNPGQFVQRWNQFINAGVHEFYANDPNNPVKNAFGNFVDDLGVPTYEKNKLYADFVQRIMEDFVKNVVQEDVVGLATKKLEHGRLQHVV